MTTPTGAIKFSDIAAEFGTSTGNSFGEYRVNQTVGDRSWPLDAGVPTSGPIKFSDLQGKTCNVVVDYTGSDIISDGSSSSRINNEVTHNFDDFENTGSPSASPSSGISVVAEATTSSNAPYDSPVNVNFTVTRDASNSNTLTLTPVDTSVSTVTFSLGSNGSETQTKSIRPLVVYIVSGGGLRILDPFVNTQGGSTVPIQRGNKIGLDDSGSSDGPDSDFNDLTVQVPGTNQKYGNTGGIFYRGNDEVYYFVYYPSPNSDETDRKHYTITFTDGTVVNSNASNIDVSVGSNLSASGKIRSIFISKKQRVSDTAIKVWFWGDYDEVNNPSDSLGNCFCRSFTISREILTSSTALGTAKANYSANGVVIGGFKSLSSATSGTKKVYHMIRRKIGGGFQSGSWEAGTQLNFIVTSSGRIYGRGGSGGQGGRQDTNATSINEGKKGGDALLLSYNANVIVESGGEIRSGGGGGGGGGYSYVGGDDTRSAGGGGGGGQGYPGGPGGDGGPLPAPSGWGGRNSTGAPGTDGSQNSPGQGGVGGGPGHWNPRKGGDGGGWGSSGNAGENGSNTGGPGGGAGLAIYKDSGVTISLDNQGTISGST